MAMAKEGIPSNVDEMARRFYGRRGHGSTKPQAAATPKVDSFGWSEPADTANAGGIIGVIRRLFGGS
jgi:hypothetical protein